MPELSIVTMQQCSDLDGPVHGTINGYKQYMYHGYSECSCPSYKYSKGYPGEKWCKHLTELQKSLCDYHEQFDGPPDVNGVCPKCGKKTSYVRVGV